MNSAHREMKNPESGTLRKERHPSPITQIRRTRLMDAAFEQLIQGSQERDA